MHILDVMVDLKKKYLYYDLQIIVKRKIWSKFWPCLREVLRKVFANSFGKFLNLLVVNI